MLFRWDNDEFDSADKPTFGEIEHVEKLVGAPMEGWSAATNTRAAIFWAVRRSYPSRLTWEQLGELAPEDFHVVVEDTEGADADPPAEPLSETPGTPGDSSAISESTTSPT